METWSHFSRIAGIESLSAAWNRVRVRARGAGLDGLDAEGFEIGAAERLEKLHNDLVEGSYAPEPAREIKLATRGRKGPRTVVVVSMRDRIVQEAVRDVLSPVLERLFADCSYAYRPGKGPQKAIRRVSHYVRYGKLPWAAYGDIRDFFVSLDHGLLLDHLRSVVEDEDVVRLVALWLKMGTVDTRGRWRDIATGAGQGAVIAPLLANLYLHPFDQAMLHEGFALVRYADDFVILRGDRSAAERALQFAASFLSDRLSLRLGSHPQPVAPENEGFSFLGIRFRAGALELDAERHERIRRRLARISASTGHRDYRRCLDVFNEAVVGWRRYYAGLLPADELANLDGTILDGLTQIVIRALRAGQIPSIRAGKEALEQVELLILRHGAEHRALLERILRRGRQATAADTISPDPGALGSVRRSVRAVVRRRKREHLRTHALVRDLVVTTPGHFLGKSGGQVNVRFQRRNVLQLPLNHLTSITVAAHGVSLSTDLVTECARQGVPILFVTRTASCDAMLCAPTAVRPGVAQRQLEHRNDSRRCLDLARRIAAGKLRNQRNLVKYLGKYHKRRSDAFAAASVEYEEALATLLADLARIEVMDPHDESFRGRVFGIEGRAAIPYWKVFGIALTGSVGFEGRVGRGARDPVNMLLNYGYALLQARMHLAVMRAGLIPEIAFLHAPQQGKPVLVFDMMEEFRPQVVDRTVLTLINRGMDVHLTEDGRLAGDTRGKLITAVQERLATLLRFRGRDRTLEEIIQHQARALVRHVEGKARYRPFVGKW